MKIESLKISNFRSFDQDGIELNLHPQMNIFIGENNVGKSNIFAALEMVRQPTGVLDCHRGNESALVTARAILTPSAAEIEQLASIFINNAAHEASRDATNPEEVYGLLRDTIRSELCKNLEVAVECRPSESREVTIYIKIGFLFLDGNHGSLHNRRPPRYQLQWVECLK